LFFAIITGSLGGRKMITNRLHCVRNHVQRVLHRASSRRRPSYLGNTPDASHGLPGPSNRA